MRKNQEQTSSPPGKGYINETIIKILDYCFMGFYLLAKLALYPLTYILYSTMSLLDFFCKLAKLCLTFVMTGIQGVQKTLKIGTFAQKIHYAILKQNGQYLKLTNKTLEEIFTCQLYDYGIRKFMSVSQLEQDIKVTQIQFWSTVGLNFIKQKFRVKNVSALTNSQQKINRFKPKMKQIQLNCCDYSGQSQTNHQDIFIFFNRTREREQHKQQIDMLKVLGYIKKNLNQHGYAVIGNYFNCQGDVNVFEEILDGFGFRIEMKEDITLNIIHSKKVLARIHKNRKIAWALGKLRQYAQLAFEHDNFFCNTVRNVWKILKQLSGIKDNQSRYNLYILEHSQ